ncbi:hypothetical protein OC861_003146 [Tilletia horrida]|nr:hypothetical protein OC861_003146 [Tilletia horrida]
MSPQGEEQSKSPSASACWRVWHTNELALSILAELNQLDLLNSSLVSKQFRFLALSRLLHSQLDIPITRVGSYLALIIQNKARALHQLRHIRIYDDILPVRLRVRPRGGRSPFLMWSPPVRPNPNEEDAHTALNKIDYRNIFALDNFLRVLSTQCAPRPPTFELTIGLSSAATFAGILQTHPFFADHLVTLRIVVDHVDEPVRPFQEADWVQYVKTAETHWANLVGLIEHIQLRPSSSAIRLQNVYFVDPRPEPTGHWYAHRRVWDPLRHALSSSVRTLALRLGSDEGEDQRECSLMGGGVLWPNLRSFSLTVHRDIGIHWAPIRASLIDFLTRHAAQLEELYIDAPHHYERQPLETAFPSLQSCEVDIFTTTQLCAFIEAHRETLQHVRFPRQPLDAPPSAATESLPENIGVLATGLVSFRGPYHPALAFARQARNITHFHLDTAHSLEDIEQNLVFQSLRRSMAAPAQAITCLDLNTNTPPSDTANEQLRETLTAEGFPNLVELRLQFPTKGSFGEPAPIPSSWIGARDQIKGILKALRGLPRLAALRLGLHAVPPLPMPEVRMAKLDDIPPSLQFLIFHPSTPPGEHYFAVLHRFKLDSATHQNTKAVTCLRRFHPIYRDTARLVDISCNSPGFGQGSGTVFDHTQSPPKLLIL